MRNISQTKVVKGTEAVPVPETKRSAVVAAQPAIRSVRRVSRSPYNDTIATHARTSFNFASRFLPEPARKSTMVLYAFFRTLDDLVDESRTTVEKEQAQREIDAWRSWLSRPESTAPREPLGHDLNLTMRRHRISADPFEHFLRGLEFDLAGGEIRNRDELEQYCFQVASTVGITMCHTLGAAHADAIEAASRLSAAMQLTNILRDVGEDLEAGRVYIPTSTLQRYGIDRAGLQEMCGPTGPSAAYRAMMIDQIELAHSWYRDGLAGVWELPEDCRFPILVAGRLYRRLLTNIENADYDTLRLRVSTSRFDKLREAIVSFGQLRLGRSDG